MRNFSIPFLSSTSVLATGSKTLLVMQWLHQPSH